MQRSRRSLEEQEQAEAARGDDAEDVATNVQTLYLSASPSSLSLEAPEDDGVVTPRSSPKALHPFSPFHANTPEKLRNDCAEQAEEARQKLLAAKEQAGVAKEKRTLEEQAGVSKLKGGIAAKLILKSTPGTGAGTDAGKSLRSGTQTGAPKAPAKSLKGAAANRKQRAGAASTSKQPSNQK